MGDENAVALSRLKRAVRKVESAQSERDRLIVETAKSNVPVPQIAKSASLSRARIYQIIAEQAESSS